MPYRQSGLSRTLPKDFTFHDLADPKTPTKPERELEVPPPPHHSSSYRLRRPRLDLFLGERDSMPFSSPDVPLPSIEFSRDLTEISSHSSLIPSTEPSSVGLLEVPPRQRLDFKTPPAQVIDTAVDGYRNWREESVTVPADPIIRPSSACSNVSDSSVSSSGSYLSRPSLGESCTSPESEIHDPFLSYPLKKHPVESPSKPAKQHGPPPNRWTGPRWTREMDNHLWNTYQMYLQDPTITPFKTMPGSLPPLGVSHRVAREARRTWSKVKFNPSRKRNHDALQQDDADDRQGFPWPGVRSGSSTPKASAVTQKPFWPRYDASTRKRLKQLCRRKFSIAPHYQRLLQSRSPSPFPELIPQFPSSGPSRRSSYSHPASFTRDLGVSLVSSSLPETIPEAVFGNELPRLGASEPSSSVVGERGGNALESWSGDNLLAAQGPPSVVPRLGSPFVYHTWGPDNSRRHLRPTAPTDLRGTVHVTGPVRRPALPDSFTNANKRRAIRPLEDDINPDGANLPLLGDLAEGNMNLNNRRVRIRNRGATLGGLSSRERLSQLFTPPSQSNSNNDQLLSASSSIRPPAEEIKRLGSPFRSDAWQPPRSPRHAPSRSDPAILSSLARIASRRQSTGNCVLPRDQTSTSSDQVEGSSDANTGPLPKNNLHTPVSQDW